MRLPRLRTGSRGTACATLLASSLLLPATASAEPEPLAPAGTGLSAPPAGVHTPGGGIWVADETRGVCRVVPGIQAALLDSDWSGAGAPRPCGGRESESGPPELGAHSGPKNAGGLVFDARTSNFYVSDRSSSGGAIWRLHLDAATGAIDRGAPLLYLEDRVERLTLGPPAVADAAPDVFFDTKSGGAIMRLADPAGVPEPPAEVADLARTDVFGWRPRTTRCTWPTAGVTRYPLGGAGETAPEPVAGFEGATVTARRARGRLYAGTSTPHLDDRVDVLALATGRVEGYEQGFAGITALGLDGDGGLLVADDAEWAIGAEGTIGEGRLWRFGLQPLDRPAVRILAGPAAVSAAGGASFSYAARDGATFECRLSAEAYAPCPGHGTGSQAYDALDEGRHVFSVRARDGVTGLAAKRAFVLDRTAPTVTSSRPRPEGRR